MRCWPEFDFRPDKARPQHYVCTEGDGDVEQSPSVTREKDNMFFLARRIGFGGEDCRNGDGWIALWLATIGSHPSNELTIAKAPPPHPCFPSANPQALGKVGRDDWQLKVEPEPPSTRTILPSVRYQ